MDAVVGEHSMDFIGHGFDEGLQEVGRGPRRGFRMQFGEGELGGPINRDDEVELALSGSNLGDVDVEEADRIGLELALGRRFAFDLRQP